MMTSYINGRKFDEWFFTHYSESDFTRIVEAFPGYTESILLVEMGLLGTGTDTIDGVEDV